MAPHLRVYSTPEENLDPQGQPATVGVTLGELLPLLAIAHRRNYVWLQDFLDDQVAITPDLYEILRTFRLYRPSA
jgi:hypothetical protein